MGRGDGASQSAVVTSAYERTLYLLANDLLDRMGEAFDLDYDRDGPIDNQAWNQRWMEVSSAVEGYLNAIPAKE